jgi:hypothetical protein
MATQIPVPLMRGEMDFPAAPDRARDYAEFDFIHANYRYNI